MSDPYAAIASAPVYGPGAGAYTGQPVSPGQASYAGSAPPPTPGVQPGGDAQTPEYQTPNSGAGQGYFVDQGGSLHVPASDPYAGIAGLDPNSNPQMPAYEDMARSAVTGVEKGIAQLAGMGGDLKNMWGRGVEGGATWLGRQLGLFTPDEIAAQNAAANGPPENFAHESLSIDTDDADKAMQAVLGPFHTPQTEGGRFAQSIGQTAPIAFTGPGGLITKAAATALGGAGAEAAGEVTQGTPLEPYARVFGGLLGGGIPQGANWLSQAPSRLVGKALGEVTPDQIDQAVSLIQKSPIPLTTAEALQQVTGGATGMGRLQHFWENSLVGGEQARPFFAQRPAAVSRAISDFADQVSPQVDNPSALGRAAQGSAQSLIDRSKGFRTQSVTPLYDAASTDTVPSDDMNDLLDAMHAHAASDKTGIVAKPLLDFAGKLTDQDATSAAQAQAASAPSSLMINGQPTDVSDMSAAMRQALGIPDTPVDPGSVRVPITDVENLDRARQYVRDNTASQIERGRMTPEQGAVLGGYLDRLDSTLENYSPSFVAGKQLYGDLSDRYVTPLQGGPVGKIAGSDDLGTQTRALYPAEPWEGQANETAQAVRQLSGDPTEGASFGGQYPITLNTDVPAALTRQHIMSTANNATADLTAGPNQWGGAAFAKAIASNPEQRATLGAGLDALPNGPSSGDMDDLLDAMQATGKRMAPGSMTAMNLEMAKALGASPSPVRTLAGLMDPLEWGRHIDKAVGGLMYRRQLNGLADLLMPPAGQEAGAFAQAQKALPDRGLLPAP